MSLIKSLFGKQKQLADLPSDSPAFQGEPIQAFDKYGREIWITRREWYDNVLKGNIEKAWDQPEELANLIHSAFNDGFATALEAPAKRLRDIDPNPERGATYLAVHYLQAENPAKAEAVLRRHIKQHGESGIVLTNLAKAQSAQGDEAEPLETFWRGLELDPNQDNALLWYESIFREKDGEAAGITAPQRTAALLGSWRPQLWLARHELKQSNPDAALNLYEQSLRAAGTPAPVDLLMQMSGDLGNAGHLVEIIAQVTPQFDPTMHGIQVGNNLIKANIDTGQLPAAKEILRQLQHQQRPDWQETIGYWETELSKAACASQNVPGQEMPSVSLLWMEGPITLKRDAPTAGLFPTKADDAPRICFIGSSAETTDMGQGIKQQGSNNAGRFSRALPLYLAEQLCADLQDFLKVEAGTEFIDYSQLQAPSDTELNHYLFRMEQSLAVRCYAMEGSNPLGLSNPAEIINGMLHCCIQNPDNLSSRLVLLRTLAALKKRDAPLTASFREKVEDLMREYPLKEDAQAAIVKELGEVFAG